MLLEKEKKEQSSRNAIISLRRAETKEEELELSQAIKKKKKLKKIKLIKKRIF
jgi:hypothetical protein